MPGKPKLTDMHRTYIVKRLACYDGPSEVAQGVQATFGVSITKQAVEYYDCTNWRGAKVAKKWKELFEATRKAFLADMEGSAPEAQKPVRLKMLAKAARKYEDRGNYVGMADMLERIAKEVGNVHTNRREVTGRDGRPIEFADKSVAELDLALTDFLTGLGVKVTGAVSLDGDDDGNGPVH